jgi:hypothetical protein
MHRFRNYYPVVSFYAHCIEKSTPYIITNVRHALFDECAVRAKRKKIKILTVATLVTRNSNEAIVAPVVGPGGGYVWR